MFVTIINDCRDPDAVGRQGSRIASLLGIAPTFVGVGGVLREDNRVDPAEFESAGCLIDALDASEGREGLILVNVANRHSKGKKWPNGTPFAYFWYKKTLVVSSVDGVVLSFVKKLSIATEIHLLDVETVMDDLSRQGVVQSDVAARVKTTQFRSFDFTPRVGAHIYTGGAVPFEVYSLDHVEDVPASVWYIDNFGNCKSSALPDDITFAPGTVVSTKFGDVTCYSHLKDVPNGVPALIVGSSGIENSRFVEFVIQGRSAAQAYSIVVGDSLV